VQQGSSSSSSAATTPTTIVAYTLSDPGSMYKTFPGSTTWFRVMHLIVPEGKAAKHVHVAAMLAPTSDTHTTTDDDTGVSNTNASNGTYGLRLVDGKGSTLFARYDCDNTENFQVFTLDLSTAAGSGSASGLLELQAQNTATGVPILFSSAIIEF
jgi:hypothetical protein